MNSIDFIIAIPTDKGANRLPRVLDRLQMQTGGENINW